MAILPINRKQLDGADRPTPGEGHWWNGTARADFGARHLGIAQAPSFPDSQAGVIALISGNGNTFSGSGFGWKSYVDDRQYYCWFGKEIPKTEFEIAVTADPLTVEEKRRFIGPDEGPAPKGWTVLFRSDDSATGTASAPETTSPCRSAAPTTPFAFCGSSAWTQASR